MPRHRGFTLIEALISIAVLAVLSGLAAPSLRDMVRTQELRSAAYELQTSMSLARSTAMTRNADTTVTASPGGWAAGWVIADAEGNAVREQDGFRGVVISGPTRVVFRPNGRAEPGGVTLGVTVDGLPEENGRCLRLNLSGQPNLRKGTCG